MLMIVQIALGIALAVLILLLLFKLWGLVSPWWVAVSSSTLRRRVSITFIAGTILVIPLAITSDFSYCDAVGIYVLIGILALGLSVLEALPPWLIKLLESLFWLFCCSLFASGLFSDYSAEQNSLLWTLVVFLFISAVMLLRSLAAVKSSLTKR
jgi:hypothetical protein